MSKRDKLEAQALEGFRRIAQEHGYEAITGQGLENRLDTRGNTYFQFGDLRVDLGFRHVVIEVESGGNLTNLVKYWYLISAGKISKPVSLYYLFQQWSRDDYASRLRLWDFVRDRMQQDLGPSITARRFTYLAIEDLNPVLADFSSSLG